MFQTEFKTRVLLKTRKTWFRTLFATFQPCPPCLKALVLGTVFGHPSGVPRGVNKSTPPKHASRSSPGHLRAPRVIFRFPEGSPFGGKIF